MEVFLFSDTSSLLNVEVRAPFHFHLAHKAFRIEFSVTKKGNCKKEPSLSDMADSGIQVPGRKFTAERNNLPAFLFFFPFFARQRSFQDNLSRTSTKCHLRDSKKKKDYGL